MATKTGEQGTNATAAVSIKDLQDLVVDFAEQRDWAQFHNPKDLAISISIEAAELLEIFQWKDATEVDQNAVAEVESEIADIFHYLLLLCHRLDIDASEAILNKLDINEGRFPVDLSRGKAKLDVKGRNDA